MTMVAVLTGLLLAAFTLLGVSVWLCLREAHWVRGAVEQLTDAAPVPRFAARVATPLFGQLQPLLNQLIANRRAVRDHDQQLLRLLTVLREPVALHAQHILFANDAFATLLGMQHGVELVGHSLVDYVAADCVAAFNTRLYGALHDEPVSARLELDLLPQAERVPSVALTQQAVDFQGQRVVLLSCSAMMSRRQGAVSGATRPRTAAWEILDSLGEGVITTNLDGHIEFLNRAAEQLIGIDLAEALGRVFPDIVTLVDEVDRHALADPVNECLTSSLRVSAGRRALMLSRGGSDEHSVDVSVSPLINMYGEQVGTAVMLRDVSELRGLARQMSYQANYDALTGLLNRREFERHTQEVIDAMHSSVAHHVLCYLDLDRFKQVNDTSGHLAGDGLLREIAALIKDTVRDSDVVGRLGGDEFGLILMGCPLEKAMQIAADVVRKVSEYQFVWDHRIFSIGVSVGLVELSCEIGTLEAVLSAADSACYAAKRRGNHVHVYSARAEVAARQRSEMQWLHRLQSALTDNLFELLVQPIVAMTTALRAEGPALEVLLRLRDEQLPEGIAPAEFMQAAERYRLMTEVDRWVVQTAFAALSRGDIHLPEGRSLAINLSGQTLADPNFLEFVVECLDRSGVASRQICFEVTENAVMSNIEHTQRFIGVLHDMGCRFALDDFGRGLSSFASLKNLAIDYLKIDGLFVRNLADDSVSQAMVAAMVKLARTLNFKVIAEQVEDSYMLEAARSMGVDFVQGFQLAKPQSLAQMAMHAVS